MFEVPLFFFWEQPLYFLLFHLITYLFVFCNSLGNADGSTMSGGLFANLVSVIKYPIYLFSASINFFFPLLCALVGGYVC